MSGSKEATGQNPSELGFDVDSERQAQIDMGIKKLSRFALRHKVWTYKRDVHSRHELSGQYSAEELLSDDNIETARQIVGDMLGRMSDRERFVVTAHFGLSGEQPRTSKDIGNELQLSASWVRDIQYSALSFRTVGDSLDRLNEIGLEGKTVIEIFIPQI